MKRAITKGFALHSVGNRIGFLPGYVLPPGLEAHKFIRQTPVANGPDGSMVFFFRRVFDAAPVIVYAKGN